MLQTFINTAGGPLSLARDYVGLQLAMQKVIRVRAFPLSCNTQTLLQPELRYNVNSADEQPMLQRLWDMLQHALGLSAKRTEQSAALVHMQDNKSADVAKTTATTPAAQSGYILEYEHGQVRNGTAAIVGST